jgi:hypothetical protein
VYLLPFFAMMLLATQLSHFILLLSFLFSNKTMASKTKNDYDIRFNNALKIHTNMSFSAMARPSPEPPPVTILIFIQT